MKKVLITLIAIIILGGVGYFTYQTLNKETPKPEEQPNEQEEVQAKKIIGAANCEESTFKICTIDEDGKIEKANEEDVLSVDGIGGRSYDIYDDVLYYIDKEYNIHMKDLSSGKEETASIKGKVTEDSYLDVYAGNDFLLMVSDEISYLYSISKKTIEKLKLNTERVVGFNYLNTDNNCFYYVKNNDIIEYNIATKKDTSIKNPYDVYNIVAMYSNNDNLVFYVEGDKLDFYAYNYKTQKINKIIGEIGTVNSSNLIVKFDESEVVYTEDNKILSKSADGKVTELYEYKVEEGDFVDYFGFSTNEWAIIGFNDLSSCREGKNDTCGPALTKMYMFKYSDKSSIDVTEEFKKLYDNNFVYNK